MEISKPIEIPLSKINLILMFLTCVIFCGLGIAMMVKPPKIDIPILSNPTVIFICGLAGLLFFGFAAFTIFKKLRDHSAGLIISDEGIFDNSSGISAGFVPWTDVTEIKETKIVNQIMVNVVVKNPQDYIARQKSAYKKKLAEINYNSFGTVIGISANGLQCSHNELKGILDNKFANFNSKKV